MRKLLILLFCCCGLLVHAQVYNNEWIDFGKTYYKIKVGKSGLHRVAKTDLAAAGLETVPVEQLQLWHNATEVPLYTPVASGPLPDGAFIEFWGERNDGKGDKPLYRKPEYQLNDRYSLQTDTSVYFLTVNATGNNKRFAPTGNNVAGNTLPPEPYFLYTLNQSFNNQLAAGFALDLDQYLYSAAYDLGEGYSSAFIGTNGTAAINLDNLFVAANGPAAQFRITVAGNRNVVRRYRVKINNDSIAGNEVALFNASKDTVAVPLSVISSATNNVQIANLAAASGDRIAVYGYELDYPRLFQFSNATNFEFVLPASNAPRYLEITAFDNGGLQPVLLDRTNGLRLEGDISVSGKIRFLVPPLPQDGSMVLYSQATANLTTVSGFTERRFTNYAQAENGADYLIISNRLLFDNGSGVNAVAQYAQYRSSAAGGAFSTRVYDVEELVDQFGWGIKKTPLAIRNFILFATTRFALKPRHVLLMGKGTVYTEQRFREADPNIARLNLVPTFGNPASDVLLAAAPGTTVPLVSIGRLSVVAPQEILDYLEKVKEYERVQAQPAPDPAAMLWQKNVAHIIGSGDPNLQASLEAFMSTCKAVVADTLWGANVQTFTKKTGANVEQISDKALEGLFEEGLSLITYFGHSSNTGLDYNLDNPEAYRNTGKYPLFLALGCSAGGIFGANTGRFSIKDAISEKYVLAPQKGTIGFIASSHFGIVSTLMPWNKHFYETIACEHYGETMGELMNATAAKTLASTAGGEENFMVRVNIEETIFHGDPALRLNVQPKPDYAITDAMVKIEPGVVSIADTVFRLKVDVANLGKAIHKGIILSVKRQFPDNTEKDLFRHSVAAPMLLNSYEYGIAVDGIQDKGMNKLIVTIDADDAVEELFESNNSISKEVFVYEEEAKPIHPYNFGIVSRPDVKLSFSTANPLLASRAYQVEMDTTELFNSAAKWSQNITSAGGLIEVQPSVLLRNGTVYYWRVAAVPDSGGYRWNKSSFVYLQDGGEGFNQSHVYQHQNSGGGSLSVDSTSGVWRFGTVTHNLFARNAMFPTGGNQEGDFTVSIDGAAIVRSACVGRSLNFTVLDRNSFKPWLNVNAQGQSLFLYGSGSASCRPGRQYNFEYSYLTPASRKAIMDFMDTIPDGSFVVIRSHDSNNPNSLTATWMGDTLLHGSGKSLYHKLLQAGFAVIDSINSPRAWLLIYQKGAPAETRFAFTQGIFDKITLSKDFKVADMQGTLESPLAGPATSWKEFEWDGTKDNSNEQAVASLIGVRADGGADTLVNGINAGTNRTDIGNIDANTYPFLRMALKTTDTVKYTPFNLSYWRLRYVPVPEGAIAPNIFLQIKDTVSVGDELQFKVAFKNVSTVPFDSLAIKMVVTDAGNVAHALPVLRHKPPRSDDTLHIRTSIDPKLFPGANTLYVQVNPDDDQPEQFEFNNFLYRLFYVQDDKSAPVVDVTFDNVRILNRDIVSAKPDILIKLTDGPGQLLLNDTALFVLKIRNVTTRQVRTYRFDNDTVRFVPATQSSQNTAAITFKPYFAEDGEYELIVSGKDRRGNIAGGRDYRVSFQVINKPMISNMLNYPNPFTTATAFVFTLTGAEVPQNLKVQILTVTGKIVREITKPELGTLRIGRNITEFKWDGTDQYGQKLGNGVYLYRVIAQLNGKSLDKYKAVNDHTDQYFNNGYGKMYLMR